MLSALVLNEVKRKPTTQDRKKFWAMVGVWAGLLFFLAPIFRSGQRTNLTGAKWLLNHTIYGPPVEFVPQEDYMRELEGTWLDEEGNLQW